MKLRKLTLSLGVILLALLAACSNQKQTKEPTLAKIACDESFETIMEQEINVYEYIYPKQDILAYYLPENAALDSILAMGSVKTAVTTRPLTQQQIDYLRSNKKIVHQQRIAVDALALIVNPQNTAEILSKNDIADILTGKITRWDQLEPSRLGKIDIIFDHQGSSTVRYMRDSLLTGRPLGPNVTAVKNNAQVLQAVQNNKNALGIIGVSWISSDLTQPQPTTEQLAAATEKSDTTTLDFDTSIKVLKIRPNDQITAYKPYQAYIFDGTYPLHRSVYMICTAPGGTTAHRFYSFVTGFQGQKIIQLTGILPATVRPRMVRIE